MSEDRLIIRLAKKADLAEASALCLRSKAHWGYDAEFMEACREPLAIRPTHLSKDTVALAVVDERLAGVLHLIIEGERAELDKLFVEPDLIGHGVGGALFDWACACAKAAGSKHMDVTSDPQALGFYQGCGFVDCDVETSEVDPDRMLPRLTLRL